MIKNTVKLISSIYTALFLLSPLHGIEEISFEKYENLSPETDLLTGSNVVSIERKLLFFPRLASFNKNSTEYAYIYDAAKNTAVKVLPEQIGFFPHTRMTYFWDPHTRINYGYVRTIPRDDSTEGWYTFTAEDNNRLMLSLQSKDEYWAYRSPPYDKISDSRILTSQYSGFIRDRSEERHYDSKFDILNSHTGEKIWEDIVSYGTSVDLYWISGPWFFKNLGARIAGFWKTDTIFNYETGEEISFAPESIIGYGNGVILTSLQTERGFIGITVWSTNKDVLYSDKEFLLTGMTAGVSKNFSGQPSIYFSYYDFPYIYCNIGELLVGGPYATLIMNLEDKKTYISPRGYHLHGVFGSNFNLHGRQ
jgi:hypothetical protein